MTATVTRDTGSRLAVWAWRAGFVAACLLQLYGVYAPREAGPNVGIPSADKIAHFFLFGSVAFLGLKVRLPARWLLGALVANAVISEVVQHYLLPQRDGNVFDAVADLAGVAVGAWLGFRMFRGPRASRTT